MKEEWKIYYIGQRVIYEVSNLGNVKRNGKLIKPRLNKSGYFGFGDGKFVHRAVAELFIPNINNKPCVDHINGIKTDNKYQNLQWATQKENLNNPNTVNNHIGTLGYSHKQASKEKISQYRKGKHRVYDDKERNIYHYE